MKTPLSSRNGRWTFICIVVVMALLVWALISIGSTDYLRQEARFQEELSAETIDLAGTILTAGGAPLGGATVTLQDQTAVTSAQGTFFFPAINRTNSLLVIEAGGFRKEFIPVHLFLPLNVSRVVVEPVLMTPSDPLEVRFLFGGDTHFGRRFIDPLETTPRDQMPPDNLSALIQVSDPGPGTRQVLKFMRPFFQEADFSVVNLESPVVQSVSTPNREKEYVLFTLPGSLPALKWLGVSYVSTGNNHVYDYQEQGITETLNNLISTGIPTSGSGSNETRAFEAYRAVIHGTPYAFLAMNSIDGSEHPVSYVATSTKGGSANVKDTVLVTSAIRRELAAGNIPIVQVHGGDEYTYEPSDYIRGRMKLVTAAGAGLVVSHHPHIAQGVGLMNGAVVIEGLGNFAFDAERHETKLGLLARVDMDGSTVQSVRLIPVYIENFTPRPLSGRLSNTFLRRIGEFSRDSPFPVYPYSGQGWVALSPRETSIEERFTQVDVTVPDSGTFVLDLRPWAEDDESLAGVWDDTPRTTARVGRDLMMGGDFEDWDLDESTGETDFWDLSAGSASLCISDPFQGTSSLCSIRYSSNNADSVVPFRNRIRVMGDALNQVPNKDLTFTGYIKGENAGPITLVAKYLASEGEMTFGEEEILSLPGGTFPWQPFVSDIRVPPDDPSKPRDPASDPRAVQIFIRHSPPKMGLGVAKFDEIALISWEETVNLSGGAQLTTPHARDFLRISGPPGLHRVSLKFRSYRPLGATIRS